MDLRRPLLALGLAVLVVSTFGSDVGAVTTTTTTTAPPNRLRLENGGTVTVAISRFPSEFNPQTPSGANATTAMIMAQVWPQLFVADDNANVTSFPGEGETGVIDSAEVTSVAPQTVVYEIDRRAVWSDGVPITAADFVYNWSQALLIGPNMPAAYPLAGYRSIASVVGSNAGKTVTVVFSHPYADWEALFANLVPSHIGEPGGWAAPFGRYSNKTVISGGPFLISKVVPGHAIVLSRNPRWWGAPAHLSRIIFLVEPSQIATIDALRAGKVDVADLEATPGVERLVASNAGLFGTTTRSSRLWQLVFASAGTPMSSVPLRMAVAKAIDRSQLLATTVGLSSAAAQVATNRLYPEDAPGALSNDGGFGVALVDQAEAFLLQAGYALDKDGYAVDAAGKRLRLTLVGPSGSPMIAMVEQEIRAALLQAGITLTVTNVTPSALLSSIIPNGRFELALAPFDLSVFPSTEAVLYSSAGTSTTPVVDTGSNTTGAISRNVIGYTSSSVTSLFVQASRQLNGSSEASLYNEIDAALWSTLPTLPLFQMPEEVVVRRDVVNVTSSLGPAGVTWDAESWAIQLSPTPTAPPEPSTT